MSAVLCGCGRLTEPGRTVAHDPACRPGDVCGPRCESVCGRCAHDIRAAGWTDDTLGNLRATTATACTFCGQPIDGDPHYPHLDGCPRRDAEYVHREFVTCTCDTPPACPTCCGCEHGEIPGQLTIEVTA